MAGKIKTWREAPEGFRWLARLVEGYVLGRNRSSAIKKQKEKIPILEAAIKATRKNLESSNKLGARQSASVNNLALYLLLLDRDVSVFRVEMVSTFEDWKLSFYARQLATILYEALDDLPPMLAKNRRLLDSLAAARQYVPKQDAIARKINPFRAKHETMLKAIRDSMGAHRPQDAGRFLDELDKINPLEVLRAGAEFFPIVEELIDLLAEVMLETGGFSGIIEQMRQTSLIENRVIG